MEDRIETKEGEFIVLNPSEKCRKKLYSITEGGAVLYLSSKKLADSINMMIIEGYYIARYPTLIEKEYCFMSFDKTGKEGVRLSLLEEYIKSKII
jgi:hypothetical protein